MSADSGNCRTINPKALLESILLKLHTSHQGTEKTKLYTRTAVYWKDMNKDLESTANVAV